MKKGKVNADPSSQIRLDALDVLLNNKNQIIGIVKNRSCAVVVTDPIKNYIFESNILTLDKEDDHRNGFGIMLTPTVDSQNHPTNTKIQYGSETKYGKIIALSTLRNL